MTKPGAQEHAAQADSAKCALDDHSSNNHISDNRSMNKDPLHGITLKMMLEELQQSLGWEGLREKININCFKSNPSIKSSLTFLRRTPWAREKVENLYLINTGHKPMRPHPAKRASVKQHSSDSQPRPDSEQIGNPWLKNKS